MKDPQCDERRLAQMLNDLLDQQEAEQVIDHLNHCTHCQSKAATLTASEAEWNQVKKALKHRGDVPSTSVPSLGLPSSDRSKAWVDSMVKQLLSPSSASLSRSIKLTRVDSISISRARISCS